MKSELVTVSNHLVRAGFQLNEWEHRIINAAVSQIQSGIAVDPNEMFVIEIGAMKDLFDPPPANIYLMLRRAVDSLYERSIDYRYSPDGVKIRGVRERWISGREYRKSEGVIAVRWNPAVLPYLSELTAQFTQYELGEIAQLSGKWAPRLYQLLMSWRGTGRFEVTVDDLRFALQPGKSYEKTGALVRSVLNPAIKELNAKLPDLKLTMVPRKRGVVISHFTFAFRPSKIALEAPEKARQSLFEPEAKPSKEKTSRAKRARVRRSLRDIENTDWG